MPAARMIGMAVGYQCGVDRTGGIYPAVRWRDIETLRFCPHPKACSDHQDSRWRRGAESPERDETDLSIRLAMGYRISQALWPCEAGSIPATRSEEHTSELQSLMRISYAVFCLKKKNTHHTRHNKP